MKETPITQKVLKEHGFLEKTIGGHLCYVRGNVAVTKDTSWILCDLHTGTPLCTTEYVNTWEEFERSMSEGGIV